MKIIASKDFTIGKEAFIKGDEIKTANFETIVKLNEQGFIEPLGYKDLIILKRELDKKEVDKNAII